MTTLHPMRERSFARSLLTHALVMLALGATTPAAMIAQAPSPGAPAAGAPRMDSLAVIFRRAQRLVNDGAGAEGRALVDSVLESTEPRSEAEAEALFWRATLAESWDRAQRDYLRLMLEHDRSPRAGDAMLRLAQGEVARGDREAAERYLERLAREAPTSGARAEGGFWHGRLLLERGQRREGCIILRETRGLVRAGAVELENQFDYLLRECPAESVRDSVPSAPASPPATPPAAPPVTPPAASPETAPATAPVTAPVARPPAVTPAAGGAWSVQVAAMSTAAEARALVDRLKAKGYTGARVDGTAAPFRIRIGRFATRADAVAASEAYRAKERADAFIVEVPRG